MGEARRLRMAFDSGWAGAPQAGRARAGACPDADRRLGGTGRWNTGGLVALVVGLSFFWQMLRHANLSTALAVAAPRGGTAAGFPWVACLYGVTVLVALGALMAGQRGASRRAVSAWCAGACLCTTLFSTVGICLPADVMAGPAGMAVRIGLAVLCPLCIVCLAQAALTLCAVLAAADFHAMLSSVFGSCFLSIIMTFALFDVMELTHAISVVSPCCAAGGLLVAGRCAAIDGPAGAGSARAGCSGARPVSARSVDARLAVLAVLLALATMLKAYCDQALGSVSGADRLVKHFVGIAELAAILMLAYTSQRADRFAAAVIYLLVGGLAVGVALTVDAGSVAAQTGSATVTSARVCAESAVLGFAALACARGRATAPRAVLCYLVLPEMAAAAVGYGVLPAAASAAGVDLASTVVPVAVAVLTCVALGAVGVLAWRELGSCAQADEGLEVQANVGRDGDQGMVGVDGGEDLARQVPPALERLARTYGLTQREVDVACYLERGYTARQVCEAECLSLNTVQSHSKNLYRKLGIHSREELVALMEDGLGERA